MAKAPKAEKAAPAETPVTAAPEKDQAVAAGPEAADEAAAAVQTAGAPLAAPQVAGASESDQPVAALPETAGAAATTDPAMAAPLAETADPSAEPKAAPAHGVGGGGGQVEKGWATVVSPISHDGADYAAGDTIPVTEAEFRVLVKAGAVLDEDWEELPIPF